MPYHTALLVVGFTMLLASIVSCGGKDDNPPAPSVEVLSTPRADMVSGGNALIGVTATGGAINVTLNGHDVTSAFATASNGRSIGLVEGLQTGANTIVARVGSSPSADLTLVNHSMTGPVFSGTQEQPFVCQTQKFPVPGVPGATLGPALDADCSVATRVDYVYHATDGSFKALPSTKTYPADLVQTTTTRGKAVPYIVRVETGTINRAIYQTAVLFNPSTDTAPSPTNAPPSWNGRLVYTYGGGCVGGWYTQGTSIGNSNGVLEDLELRQGYAIASSTLNVFGNNCNDVVASETTMMVRERFIKTYGPPDFTIGLGCSAGAEEAHTTADNYPGLLDGIIVGCSFSEPTASLTFPYTDSDLLWHYLQGSAIGWSEAQIVATSGLPSSTVVQDFANTIAPMHKPIDANCPGLSSSETFNATSNPKGVRCDFFDHNVNLFGKHPATGYARRTIDNVGVQYGLAALNAGAITKTQFLDLNANIGGFDNNGSYSASRAVADPTALDVAYKTGRVLSMSQGLATTPIIDYRSYVDLVTGGLETHQRAQSFAVRARLQKANGNFDNQVMLTKANTYGNMSDDSPVVQHALTQMDE